MTIAGTDYWSQNINREAVRNTAVSDEDDIEALIDSAGRSNVFAQAELLGWNTGNPPPKWVWRQIADQILRNRGAAR